MLALDIYYITLKSSPVQTSPKKETWYLHEYTEHPACDARHIITWGLKVLTIDSIIAKHAERASHIDGFVQLSYEGNDNSWGVGGTILKMGHLEDPVE